jgi:hypothetical protein
MILEKLFIIISDLCGPFDVAAQDMLSVPSATLRTCFAGDIPSLGCGYDYKPDKVPTA